MSKASLPVRVGLVLAAALSCGAASRAQVLFVDASAPPGGDGSSWAAATSDLSSALASASPLGASEVWVAEGRYVPADTALGFVLPDGVRVYGGFAGTESSPAERVPGAHPTLLDGDVNGDDLPDWVNYADNCEHVVRDSGGARTHLDGFTIRGGRGAPGAGLLLRAHAVTLASLVVEENRTFVSPTRGGGASVTAGTLEVRDCIFRENHSTSGGGLWLWTPTAVVSGCRFERNHATSGGGLDLSITTFGELRVERCVFEDNEATGGGGISVDADSFERVAILDSEFRRNRASSGGGLSVVAEAFDVVAVERSTFERNTATSGAGIEIVSSRIAALEVRDSSFRANRATSGACASLLGSHRRPLDARFVGCAFEDNDACAAAGIWVRYAALAVERCAFLDNHYLPPSAGICFLGAGGGAIRAGEPESTVRIVDSTLARSESWLVMLENGASAVAERSTLANVEAAAAAIRLLPGTKMHFDGCIVWSDLPDPFEAHASAVVTASWSVVSRGGAPVPGPGNFYADPQFVDVYASDLRLAPGSPCIDAGDPALLPVGADLAGYSRVTDGDLDGELRIDLGAREASPATLAVVREPAARTLTIVTSGVPGLRSELWLGRPGQRFLPRAGTLFLDAAGLVRAPWPSAPSSVSLAVPPGLTGLHHLQEIVFQSGARALSNHVRLEL